MSILIKGMEMPKNEHQWIFADLDTIIDCYSELPKEKNMSILIKGIEMPKDKEIILRIDEEGQVYNIYGEYPTKTYEAIEIPPHGRLIDADAFCAKIIEIVERQKYDEAYTQSLSIGEILREVVHELRGEGLDGFANAPTIIESEGDK